ncbi:hypothetical protein [Ancylomarina sp. 16SWW S1-10-2]|uniref:hypothetical protein n=1 Tax=Ancylomarina sp. 16SWW S1-10-2 TaxID=2499681 RepID=UPI0012AEA9DB|nr:hypothetical protein [Ancylomarina sp. 16SWW S1-10-2]MRT92840.1 hypothetical protein [Ancylomarina sp. 16SWW S1-10-2]
MIYKFLIIFQLIGFLSIVPSSEEAKVKAWIEIEGELDTMSIRALIENDSDQNMFLSYELETYNYSRIKDKKTLQKGKFRSLKESITDLKESRLNLRSTQKLCVRIRVLNDNKIVASDSVVFQGVSR